MLQGINDWLINTSTPRQQQILSRQDCENSADSVTLSISESPERVNRCQSTAGSSSPGSGDDLHGELFVDGESKSNNGVAINTNVESSATGQKIVSGKQTSTLPISPSSVMETLGISTNTGNRLVGPNIQEVQVIDNSSRGNKCDISQQRTKSESMATNGQSSSMKRRSQVSKAHADNDVVDPPTTSMIMDDMMGIFTFNPSTPFTKEDVIYRGWLYKLGTGQDWFGSKCWKPRWAMLAVSRGDLLLLSL